MLLWTITFNVSLIENPVIESTLSGWPITINNIGGSGMIYLTLLNGVDFSLSILSNVPKQSIYSLRNSNKCDVIVTQDIYIFHS
jgi:hypothetical protein